MTLTATLVEFSGVHHIVPVHDSLRFAVASLPTRPAAGQGYQAD